MEPAELRCEQISAQDIPSRYVLGELSEPEQDAFEQHYFECERCFEAVRTCQALQASLARRPRRNWLPWAACAAAAALLLAAGLELVRRPVSPAPVPHAAVKAAPAPMQLLAEFTPPVYTSPQLRSASGGPFTDAMARYQQGDWTGAIAQLRPIMEQNPDHQAAHFFLGICYLLTKNPADGIPLLQDAVRLGGAAYLEEAHYYLAKAYLGKNDATRARAELNAIVDLHGDMEPQVRDLLGKLDAAEVK